MCCCVAHLSVLLSMLLLVEASYLGGRPCLHNVAAKVEGILFLCRTGQAAQFLITNILSKTTL
jgi:hypothetical protein